MVSTPRMTFAWVQTVHLAFSLSEKFSTASMIKIDHRADGLEDRA